MKILLIKLGVLGDVLRTTPVLRAIKKAYPACEITWVVSQDYAEVLENNPFIDVLLTERTWKACCAGVDFDLAANLDKDPVALEMISEVSARKKMGFGRDAKGELCAIDSASDYAYRLGLDDELKFRRNQKTYQQITFEQLGREFQGEEYVLNLDGYRDFADTTLARLGVDLGALNAPLIGLNTGSGRRFAGKKLPEKTYAELAALFHKKLGAIVLLLGGEDEKERNRNIAELCEVPVIDAGSHPIKGFAALVRECDLVVTGDTTAMHVAIAVKTPVLAHFGSTCAAEIELYQRGAKLVSELPCAPCYKNICPIGEPCVNDLAAESVFEAAKAVLS